MLSVSSFRGGVDELFVVPNENTLWISMLMFGFSALSDDGGVVDLFGSNTSTSVFGCTGFERFGLAIRAGASPHDCAPEAGGFVVAAGGGGVVTNGGQSVASTGTKYPLYKTAKYTAKFMAFHFE